MVRDVQSLSVQQGYHARRRSGIWFCSRRGDLHLEVVLCRQVLTIGCREDTFGGIVRTQKQNGATHGPFPATATCPSGARTLTSCLSPCATHTCTTTVSPCDTVTNPGANAELAISHCCGAVVSASPGP